MTKSFRLIAVAVLVLAALVSGSSVSHAQSDQICVWCYFYFSPDGRNWCEFSRVDFESQTCEYYCHPLLEDAPVPEPGGPVPWCQIDCQLSSCF